MYHYHKHACIIIMVHCILPEIIIVDDGYQEVDPRSVDGPAFFHARVHVTHFILLVFSLFPFLILALLPLLEGMRDAAHSFLSWLSIITVSQAHVPLQPLLATNCETHVY